jgi:DHA2 family multidrug resistance protein-like MFS transporter
MAHAAPVGVPPEAMIAARRTLGGALAVAESLAPQLGAELLGAARHAFAQSFQLAAAASAAVAVATAVIALALLRDAGSKAPAGRH